MLIARRADTRARADFRLGSAKLGQDLFLPADAQNFLAAYSRKQMTDAEASEATIGLMYKSYYAEMGGGGAAPDVPSRQPEPAADNVTAFRRPPARPKPTLPGTVTKPRLPVALIFACLVVVYVGIRYYWR